MHVLVCQQRNRLSEEEGEEKHCTEEDVLFISDSPICSQKFASPPQLYTGIGRPINFTCHMNNGNPTRNNFTWHLPNGSIYFGHSLNSTSSYLTITPGSITDFGQITCRAQNELGLAGECHINMSLGGLSRPFTRELNWLRSLQVYRTRFNHVNIRIWILR